MEEIIVPNTIFAERNDYVSYRTITPGGSLKPDDVIIQDHLNQGCYGRHINSMGSHEFMCFPNRISILPGDIFMTWMGLCQLHNLVPREAVPERRKDQNILTLPRKDYSRHVAFTALCCYRWAENLAPLAYTVVKLLEVNPKLSFYQVLHYAMGKYIVNYGHSFCNICPVSLHSAYYRYGRSGQWFLPWSLAIRDFFVRDADGNSIADTVTGVEETKSGYGYTSGAIVALVQKKWGINEPHKPAKGETARLCVRELTDLLREEVTEFYALQEPTKESMLECWTRIVKK